MPEAERSPTSFMRSNNTTLVWNVLTLLILLASLTLVVIFAVIFINPYAALNPFPPPTPLAVLAIPTSTPTPLNQMPPTWTPEASPTFTITPTPTETPTEFPSQTLEPSATPTLDPRVTPSPTLRPTATAGGYAFVPQEGSPAAISYSIYSDVGCQFLGVGGRVLGLDGSPITPGVIVRLRGTLDGQSVSLDTLSGTATQYGESGFGFQLSDHPIASGLTLYIQLVEQAYLPMSDRIYFETFDTCDKNLIFITFRQVR